MKATTACSCTKPGWCSRHECYKSEMLHGLCQRHAALFAAWEQGQGPGQFVASGSMEPSSPGLVRRGLDFALAGARHLADGLRKVDPPTFDARLAVCAGCPSCDTTDFICREVTCGCYLREKAWWASESCPLAKWPPAVDDLPSEGSTGPSRDP